jgi:hypothetical protein
MHKRRLAPSRAAIRRAHERGRLPAAARTARAASSERATGRPLAGSAIVLLGAIVVYGRRAPPGGRADTDLRLRVSDTVARLGGDEFAALLAHVDIDVARVAAGKLVDAIAWSHATARRAERWSRRRRSAQRDDPLATADKRFTSPGDGRQPLRDRARTAEAPAPPERPSRTRASGRATVQLAHSPRAAEYRQTQ